MFWSHDLLGKKTALGAIWIAAHGKKLNKSNILKVNVAEACNKVMDPEVPQALRLQAILVGGIVIVHARQQVYLLEDAQEMLRRLRALDTGEGGIGGAGAAPRAVLGGGKRAAREEAITLPLNADLGLMNLGDLFPTFPTQALSEGGASGAGGQVGGDLFVMPSLPDGPEASSGAPSRGRGAAAQEASGGAGGSGAGARGLLMLGAEEPDLQLEGLGRYDLELMDGPETFAVPDLDMPGMEMFQLPAHLAGRGAAPASSAGRAESERPPADELVPVPSALLGEEGFVPEGHPEVQQQQQQQPSSQTPQTSEERSARARGSGAAAQPRGRGGQGRRGGLRRAKATVDDIETLQIRGRDYREWMADHSDLLVPRPLRALGAAPAGTGSKAAFVAAPATAAYLPGGAWPEELRELFAHVCSIPSAGENIRAKRGKGEAAAGEEEEGLPGEREQLLEERRRAGGSHDSRRSADALLAPGGGLLPGEDVAGLDMGVGGFHEYGYGEEPAVGPPEAGGYDAGAGPSAFAARGTVRQLSRGSEGQSDGDQDVETERLRAALNSTQGLEPFFPLGQTPASGGPGGALLAGGRGARSKRASSLLRRDSESGVLSEKSSERRDSRRLSDLPEGGPLAGEDLGAMLPAVGEEEPFLDERGGSRRKRRRTGEEEEPSAPLEGTGLTQFELLEASAPTQALPSGPLGDSLNRQTLAFVGVMHARFQAAEAQQEDGGAARLSLLGMAERLSRMDAAKLFYQALVARSHHFLGLEQAEPYGDILLSRGDNLQAEDDEE